MHVVGPLRDDLVAASEVLGLLRAAGNRLRDIQAGAPSGMDALKQLMKNIMMMVQQRNFIVQDQVILEQYTMKHKNQVKLLLDLNGSKKVMVEHFILSYLMMIMVSLVRK